MAPRILCARSLSFLQLALLLAACTEVARVSVGSLSDDAIDLRECGDEKIRCAGRARETVVVPHTETAPETCSPDEEPPWSVVWARDLRAVDCGELRTCRLKEFAVAGDGTVWAAGIANLAQRGGIFVRHYDHWGRVIAEGTIEDRQLAEPGRFEHLLAIAADARGHLYVAVVWNETSSADDRYTTSAWLGEYTADVRLVRRRPLHGIPPNAEIGLAAADSLYLVVAAAGSVTDELGTTSLLSFGSDLEPHWLQPNALPNSDPRRTLAFEGNSALIAGADSPRKLTCLGDDGGERGVLRFSEDVAPFGIDGDCTVTALEARHSITPSLLQVTSAGEIVYRVSIATLDAAERYPIIDPALTVDSSGTQYFLRATANDAPAIGRMQTLDATGHSCTSALLLDAANYIDRTFQWHLMRSESGELYLSYGVGVARLMR